MKRMLCLLFALLMLASLGTQAFADEIMYCRMCGKQIPADSKVCPFCGEKVVRVSEAASGKTEEGTDTKAPVSAPRISSPSPATAPAVAGPFGTNSVVTSAGAGKVYVTKSPTSESVPYGGSCMFIAHAANATSVTWYIGNADLSLITTAAEAPGRVSGLSVSGANADTLVLSGIPSWMNGCQVQACFTGDGGPVYTDIARIWTYEEPSYQNDWGSPWDWWRAAYWHDVMDGLRLSDESDYIDHDDLDFDFNPFNPTASSWSITAETDEGPGADDYKEEEYAPDPDDLHA